MIETSEKTDLLVTAFLETSRTIKPAKKSGHNKFHSYHYATEEDWFDAVRPSLLTNGLVLSFSVTNTQNLDPRKTKKGATEYVVEVHGVARLMHISGQWLEIQGVGQGQEGSDKAAYQAMTGMKKYLYALLFALPTTDDPERDNRQPDPPQQQTQPEPRQKTEEERFAEVWEYIVAAANNRKTLTEYKEAIPNKNFSPGNVVMLIKQCDTQLSACPAGESKEGRFAMMMDSINAATNNPVVLLELGMSIPSQGFSPERQQQLIDRCTQLAAACEKQQTPDPAGSPA